uniref:Uncharacterized protein n=1 Tax=Trichuris muris TaxID=70415 RepID=A0A5S6QF50_TRIMR
MSCWAFVIDAQVSSWCNGALREPPTESTANNAVKQNRRPRLFDYDQDWAAQKCDRVEDLLSTMTWQPRAQCCRTKTSATRGKRRALFADARTKTASEPTRKLTSRQKSQHSKISAVLKSAGGGANEVPRKLGSIPFDK